jgi:hypothetical protein
MRVPGEWDGAGAVVKTALRNEQRLNPNRELQNALQCVQFLTEKLSTRVSSTYSKKKPLIFRKFWHIDESAVVRSNPFACATIPGSRSLHSVFSFSAADPTKLMVRQLSCFCPPCVDEDWDNCESKDHVKPWRCVKLKPSDTSYVREQMVHYGDHEEWEFGGDGEELSDLLNIGDNFVVPAEGDNSEGVDFYILQCQRPKFKVRESFSCVWGCDFEAGDLAIGGTYYQKWGSSNKSYVYLSESNVAYIHAHLVCASKFAIPPANHRVKGDDPVYSLSNETLELIRSAINEDT